MTEYECPSCGDTRLVIEVEANHMTTWTVSCGNGHKWLPSPGTAVRIEVPTATISEPNP